ncbi:MULTISPECIES: helix-turn-helix domain-containing protein [Photorhabdus]|uniref:Antitoxin HipB n=1 Tax=Photorhabdus namnaonensis TaxID=1851568 RepID=A0A1B8YGH1_9GAMM|nr:MULTISPECIES: helix-turn-helix transcriptional regulator [Photorhabdus]MBS9427834.1 XRE family transcriptional regulator [Photorhabdus akhurstii]OCA54241.1 antitoxin HipB [Photorhabdus namnaonensis]PQQ30621.1 XRE family transcriptional regulator [Photorhabdus luminescens]
MGTLSSSYAEKLKLIRKAEGLTQVAFAKELGLGLSTVKNYETGHKDPGLSTIGKVTNHPRFEKYTMWLMSNKTLEMAGQISPALSPDGRDDDTYNNQSGQKAG